MKHVMWKDARGLQVKIAHTFSSPEEALAYALLLEESGLVVKAWVVE